MSAAPFDTAFLRDRRRALALLMAVGLFNFVDRLCMSILSVPIRRELELSDTQIGILTGLAFSLVYTLTAVPIARLADRGSRKRVLVGCLALWSLMTAGCGLATSFLVLALLRMGVALGEAGCVPATQALLSDYYPRTERARALATWQLVLPVGTLVGFAASGWLNAALGWRNTFLVLGVVGLLLAPLVHALLREPARGAADAPAPATATPGRAASAPGRTASADDVGVLVALRELWSLRSYRYLLLGGAFLAWPMNVTLYWNGQFYSRVHGLSLGQVALWLALLAGVAGGIGLFGGGWLADRLGRKDPRWQLWVPGLAGLAVAPCMLAQYFVPGATTSLWLGIAPAMLLNAFMPPQAAGVQSLARPERRALASGTIVLVSGTVGTAIGPFATGVISDLLAQGPVPGPEALRWAVGGSGLLAALGGLLFLVAGRHYPADLAEVAGRPG